MISYSEQIAQLKKERDNALAQCGETFAKLSDVSIGASRKVLAMTVELKECKQDMSDILKSEKRWFRARSWFITTLLWGTFVK